MNWTFYYYEVTLFIMHFFLKVILSEVNDFTGFLLINIFMIYKSPPLNLPFSSHLTIFVARGFCLPYLCLFCVWISGYHIQIDWGLPTAPQLFRRFVPIPRRCCGLDLVQPLSHVRLFVTPWTGECQASLSITNSWSFLKLMCIDSVMPSNHLILCHPLLLLPSIFPSIRVFSNE